VGVRLTVESEFLVPAWRVDASILGCKSPIDAKTESSLSLSTSCDSRYIDVAEEIAAKVRAANLKASGISKPEKEEGRLLISKVRDSVVMGSTGNDSGIERAGTGMSNVGSIFVINSQELSSKAERASGASSYGSNAAGRDSSRNEDSAVGGSREGCAVVGIVNGISLRQSIHRCMP